MNRMARWAISAVCLSAACFSAMAMVGGQSAPERDADPDASKVRRIDAGLDEAWFLLEIERDPRAAIVTVDAAIAARRHPVPRTQRYRAAVLRLVARALLGVAEDSEFTRLRKLDDLPFDLEETINDAWRRSRTK